MSLSVRLAWRNLWRQKRRTWLTASAMVFSNVLLVFMIAFQLGSYSLMIENSLRPFTGYVQVQAKGYLDEPRMRTSIPNVTRIADRMRNALDAGPPDSHVAARGSAFALASSEQRSLGIQVTGVQPAFEPRVSTLPGLVREGSYLEDPLAAEIVVGATLARNLKIGVGDELTLLGSGRDGSFAAGVVTVIGLFESGVNDIDRNLAEVPLAYFQETFAMGDAGHHVVVSLPGIDAVAPARERITRELSGEEGLVVLDWDELLPGLKQAIQADFGSAWLMYIVLIVLVAFSVLNTQLMSVMERTHEFGVISALGVKPRRLSSLVVLESVLMALLGLSLGVLLGGLLTAWFSVHGITIPGMEDVAARFNMPSTIYPLLGVASLFMGPVVVFLFSILASFYPAMRLLRLRPVEAMRSV